MKKILLTLVVLVLTTAVFAQTGSVRLGGGVTVGVVNGASFPTVGTDGQCLVKDSGSLLGVAWASCGTGGGGTWGSITGTLSAQTDLNTALAGKLSSSTVLPANTTSTANNFFTAYDNTTGAFTKARPTCGALSDSGTLCTSSAILAQTKAAITSNWIRSYDSSTGAFTASQPAFSDISGSLATTQMPGLTGDATSSAGTVATTVAKINGTTVPTNSAADQVLGTTASATAAWFTLPACANAVTSKLLYDTATHAFSCGTDQGGGGGMTNPMTTLGDIIYEDASPTPARLAGNTTTTKKYLSQTGNGSISAVPAWAQVAYADISGTPTLAVTKTAVSGQPLLSYDSTTGAFTQGALTATNVGLGSVTNDAQTKAAIVPNTAPSAGQLLVGNAGGTAYAPISASADATVASTGAVTVAKVNGTSVPTNSAADQTIVTTASATGAWKALPACANATTSKLLYDTATHAFSCGTDQGSGTVTVVGAGALTSTALVTGGGTTTLQTPAATATMDSSGNISTPGSITAASMVVTGTAGADDYTQIAAPASPAAGHLAAWADSTDARFHDKNPAGTIGTTVVADTGTTNNFLTAISAAGVVSKARPTCANLSDSTALCSTTPGTGAATFLTTPSSANLRAALTDESGTGVAYFQGGDIGTPSAGVLTNATGLPVASGISGLGTGVATFLATPSSANLASAVTGETGSGGLVFGTNPTLAGPVIGSSVVASLPAASGATGQVYVVTDSNSASACTTGSSSNIVLCRSNGTSWLPLGDGTSAGGGVTTGVTLTADQLVFGAGTSTVKVGNLTGDATTSGGTAVTVGKINGVALSGLATGILKNTTTTGAPSIAVAGDFPTLNQNTSGTAAGLSATLAIASGGTGTASTLTGLVRGSASAMTAAELSGDVTTSGSNAVTLAAKYKTWTCETGLGDGLTAVTAGTYLQSFCWNKTGATVTLTGVQCYTDNAGSSTLNAAGNTLGALLTGAVTCSSTIASGTQSANVALTNGDYIKFTWVADGTSKQSTWVVTGTY